MYSSLKPLCIVGIYIVFLIILVIITFAVLLGICFVIIIVLISFLIVRTQREEVTGDQLLSSNQDDSQISN